MDTKMLAIVGIVVVIAVIALVYFMSQPQQPPTPPKENETQPTPPTPKEKVQVSDVKALLTQSAPVSCNYDVKEYRTANVNIAGVKGKAYINGNWVKVEFDSTPALLQALSGKVDTSYIIANVDPNTMTATIYLKAKNDPNCDYYWIGPVSVPNVEFGKEATGEQVSADCYKQSVTVEQPEKKEGCQFNMGLVVQ